MCALCCSTSGSVFIVVLWELHFVIHCTCCRCGLVHAAKVPQDTAPLWRLAKRSVPSSPQHPVISMSVDAKQEFYAENFSYPGPGDLDQRHTPQPFDVDSGEAYLHQLVGHQLLPTKRRRMEQIAQLSPRITTAEEVLASTLLAAPLFSGSGSASSQGANLDPLDKAFFLLMGQPGESSMMSQPGSGAGCQCSSAYVKLPHSFALEDEAFVRWVREAGLCINIVVNVLQNHNLKKYIQTIIWILVGAVCLSHHLMRCISSVSNPRIE